MASDGLGRPMVRVTAQPSLFSCLCDLFITMCGETALFHSAGQFNSRKHLFMGPAGTSLGCGIYQQIYDSTIESFTWHSF